MSIKSTRTAAPFAAVFNRSRNQGTNQSPPGYTIVESTTSINEGSSVTFTVTTGNVPSGTTLYWTTNVISGTVNASDFSDSATSGSFTVTGNYPQATGTITRTLSNDITTEGSESFQIQIRTESTSGPIVATSATVTINDTSLSPTYSVSPSTSSINEGSTVTFTITTTNVSNGTTLYWTTNTVSGTVNASDFSDSATSGSFTITSNSGTVTRTLSNDNSTEGSESFQLQIRTGSTSGTIVATSSTVTINDTSVAARTVLVKLWGAGGAAGSRGGTPCGGGGGSYVTASFVIGNTTPASTTFYVYVGGGGGPGNSPGWIGGGAGGPGPGEVGGGGGGMSFITAGTPHPGSTGPQDSHIIALAAGGAGAGPVGGGGGGGAIGGSGSPGNAGGPGFYGQGGNPGSGGNAGGNGNAGSKLRGGAGGASESGPGNPAEGGGGGGAGWYGGGGGGKHICCQAEAAGGGGGSSYGIPGHPLIENVSYTSSGGGTGGNVGGGGGSSGNTSDPDWSSGIGQGGTSAGSGGGAGKIVFIYGPPSNSTLNKTVFNYTGSEQSIVL